ncbi:MAG: hypothetical protein ACOZAA_09640 [Pseudomonadota bacterium]
MNVRALFIALSIASAPLAARAEAATAADPFEAEPPMSDAALAAARGGLVVNGFLIDFAVQTTLIIDTAGALSGHSTPIAFEFDPSVNSLIINNSVDGVEITRIVALDVAVRNFTSELSSVMAASAGAGASIARLSLNGF